MNSNQHTRSMKVHTMSMRERRKPTTSSDDSSNIDGDVELEQTKPRSDLQPGTTIQTRKMGSPVKMKKCVTSQKKPRLQVSQENELETSGTMLSNLKQEALPAHATEQLELDQNTNTLIVDVKNILTCNKSVTFSDTNILKNGVDTFLNGPNSLIFAGYTPEFLLKVWRISNKFRLNDDAVLLPSNLTPMKRVIVNFMAGKWLEEMTIENMYAFLRTMPQRVVGNFVIGLMLVEYTRSLSPKDAVLFLEKKDKFTQELYPVVEIVVAFVTLCHLRQTTTFETLLQSIPRSLRHVINLSCFDMLTIETTNANTKSQNNQNSSIITMTEFSCASSLREILFQLMFADLRNMLSKDTIYSSRVEKWTRLANICVDDMIQSKKTFYLEILLKHDLQKGIGTTKMFNIIDDEQNILSISIHPDVVHRFGGKHVPDLTIPIPASRQDVETLLMLLYNDKLYDPSIIKNRLSLGVYKLAVHLQIENIWWLLFQNHPYKELMTRRNRVDILHIAIFTMNEECVYDIARNFQLWMHEQFTKCLNGLSPEQVQYFIKRASSHVETLELYKILIQWSFSRTAWECANELDAPYKKDVYRNFALVKNSLNLAKLRNHKHVICCQNYVSLREIEIDYEFRTRFSI